MSNFIENIKVNNLTRRLNALATEVANIVVGGAPVITGDIDMNNNSIAEIDQLIFNSGHAIVDNEGTLNFANKDLVSSSDLAPYMTKTADSNLDMNNNEILNINGFEIVDNTEDGAIKNFTLINGGLVSSNETDVRVYLYTNETDGLTRNLDFDSYPLDNVGSVNFVGGGSLVSSDDSTILFNNAELATYNLTNDINGQNQYSLRQISNLTLTSGGGVLFGGIQNKLVPDADDDATILYQNVPLISANNISDYLPGPTWVDAATSSLNMQFYNISNITTLTAGAVNPNSINFESSTNQKLTVLGGELQYQGATVITNSDIASYFPTQVFQPTATQDLNMSNYSVRDALVGEFNSINFAANPSYHLSATADGLLYQGGVMAPASLVYDNSLIYNDINAAEHALLNTRGVSFDDSSTIHLTMDNDGQPNWEGELILTAANSNVPAAPQTYNITSQSGFATPNIPISADSCNLIKGTIVSSTFVIEFQGVAINVGGEDPKWVEETQSTTVIYESTGSTFDLVGFNATSSGVYIGVALNTTTTDTFVVSINKLNNK